MRSHGCHSWTENWLGGKLRLKHLLMVAHAVLHPWLTKKKAVAVAWRKREALRAESGLSRIEQPNQAVRKQSERKQRKQRRCDAGARHSDQ